MDDENLLIPIQHEGGYVNYESLLVGIHCRCCKFLLINDQCPLDSWQRLGGNVRTLDESLLCKSHVCIAECEERHSDDHFHAGVGPQ